jgi:hypothetical protein
LTIRFPPPLTAARTILIGCGLVKNLRPAQQIIETKGHHGFFELQPIVSTPRLLPALPRCRRPVSPFRARAWGSRGDPRDVTAMASMPLPAQENSVETSRLRPQVPPLRPPDFRQPRFAFASMADSCGSVCLHPHWRAAKMPPTRPVSPAVTGATPFVRLPGCSATTRSCPLEHRVQIARRYECLSLQRGRLPCSAANTACFLVRSPSMRRSRWL